MEESDRRWRGAIRGGGEGLQVEGPGEQSQVKGGHRRSRGAIGGKEKGSRGVEWSQAEGSDRRWREASACGGK